MTTDYIKEKFDAQIATCSFNLLPTDLPADIKDGSQCCEFACHLLSMFIQSISHSQLTHQDPLRLRSLYQETYRTIVLIMSQPHIRLRTKTAIATYFDLVKQRYTGEIYKYLSSEVDDLEAEKLTAFIDKCDLDIIMN